MRKFANSHHIEARRIAEAEAEQRRQTVDQWKQRLIGAVVDPVAAALNIARWHEQHQAGRRS